MSLLDFNLEKSNRFNEWMADEFDRRSEAQRQAERDRAYDLVRLIEAGNPDATAHWNGKTAAQVLDDALDYRDGPGTADVLRVIAMAMKCADPIAALAARQLVERCGAKYGEFNADEVDE